MRRMPALAAGRPNFSSRNAGQQRGVQVQLLRSRQAQLNADGIALLPCRLTLRDMLFQLNDLVALFAVLFHRGAFQCVVLVQHCGSLRRVA